MRSVVLFLAVVIPLLGWLGFIQAGKLVERMAATPGWLTGTRMGLTQAPQDELQAILDFMPFQIGIFLAILASVFVARYLRLCTGIGMAWFGSSIRKGNRCQGRRTDDFGIHPDGRHSTRFRLRWAGTLHDLPVQVTQGLADLDKPSELEAKALGRITAPVDVRLATAKRDRAATFRLSPSAAERDGPRRSTARRFKDKNAKWPSCSSIYAARRNSARIACLMMSC